MTAPLRIEQFKKKAQQHCVQPDQQLPLEIDLITGSMAGGIAGAITTPLDVLKTLLQTQHSATNTSTPHQSKHYRGIMEGLIWNYKHQGLAGLFRGIGPRVFWTSLQSALMFVIYEQVLHLEESMRNADSLHF